MAVGDGVEEFVERPCRVLRLHMLRVTGEGAQQDARRRVETALADNEMGEQFADVPLAAQGGRVGSGGAGRIDEGGAFDPSRLHAATLVLASPFPGSPTHRSP
ncbi:hypothetical protein MTP03_19490 [Tsukamurella sp. PLM1]|nr:hypothetical protein MTP03_19490 [Tsukamurella sp. PLM1]